MDAVPLTLSPTKTNAVLPSIKDAALSPTKIKPVLSTRSRPSTGGKKFSFIEGDLPTVVQQLKHPPSSPGKFAGQDPSTILVFLSPCRFLLDFFLPALALGVYVNFAYSRPCCLIQTLDCCD
jgi:hypothetical protein